MPAEGVPGHGFVTGDVPLHSPDDSVQIFPELRPKPEKMRGPPNNDRQVLQAMRTNRYSEPAAVIVGRRYSPRHRRLSTALPAYLQVVADSFDPFAKTALEDPAAEIVNFIPGFRPGPGLHRVTRAERMAVFEVPGSRNCLPYFVRRCCNRPFDRYRPSELRFAVTCTHRASDSGSIPRSREKDAPVAPTTAVVRSRSTSSLSR